MKYLSGEEKKKINQWGETSMQAYIHVAMKADNAILYS